MNVRNLFLMSMMVCAAPVVCAVSEVSLTKQEQEIIKEWVKNNIQNQHSVVKQVFKLGISSLRDHFLVCLGKMLVGKNKLELSNEMAVENQIFQSKFSIECKQLMNKLIKKIRVNEREIKVMGEQILRLIMEMSDLSLNKLITAEDIEKCSVGEYITEANRIMMKKLIAIYSFMLKCL